MKTKPVNKNKPAVPVKNTAEQAKILHMSGQILERNRKAYLELAK